MGYYKNSRGIECFDPDNTDTEFYFWAEGTWDMLDPIEAAAKHFKCCTSDILHRGTIRAEHIHVRCLGYDSYDRGDWSNYIVITYKKG